MTTDPVIAQEPPRKLPETDKIWWGAIGCVGGILFSFVMQPAVSTGSRSVDMKSLAWHLIWSAVLGAVGGFILEAWLWTFGCKPVRPCKRFSLKTLLLITYGAAVTAYILRGMLILSRM